MQTSKHVVDLYYVKIWFEQNIKGVLYKIILTLVSVQLGFVKMLRETATTTVTFCCTVCTILLAVCVV